MARSFVPFEALWEGADHFKGGGLGDHQVGIFPDLAVSDRGF